MKIQIIGTGIVGEATARLASELGNEVLGYDIKPKKSPYYKQGLAYDADIVFICVMETTVPEVIADLINNNMLGLFVVRSSVQPFVIERLIEEHKAAICHNPEFLHEASYLDDAIHPKVIVYGGTDYGYLCDFYSYYKGRVPIYHTNLRTSSLVKLQMNNYRATLISFWNSTDEICRKIGVDTARVAQIMKKEGRANGEGCRKFGEPYDGKCLPKDIRQTIEICREMGVDPSFWASIEDYNNKLRNQT